MFKKLLLITIITLLGIGSAAQAKWIAHDDGELFYVSDDEDSLTTCFTLLTMRVTKFEEDEHCDVKDIEDIIERNNWNKTGDTIVGDNVIWNSLCNRLSKL